MGEDVAKVGNVDENEDENVLLSSDGRQDESGDEKVGDVEGEVATAI